MDTTAICRPVLHAIILAGGLGTRVRAVLPDVPKPMARVAGAPFLEWVVRHLENCGVSCITISAGHKAEVITQYFRTRTLKAAMLNVVTEERPLGTGGAVRFAWNSGARRPSDHVLVLNGDSLVKTDFRPLIAYGFHSEFDAVILGLEVEDSSRYGSLEVAAGRRLLGFREKRPGRGLINAGVYLFRPALLDDLSDSVPLSLEKDEFPRWLAQGRPIGVYSVRAPFLDIGTPESLAQAEAFIRGNFAEAATGPS